jgi:hypothetical protein
VSLRTVPESKHSKKAEIIKTVAAVFDGYISFNSINLTVKCTD